MNEPLTWNTLEEAANWLTQETSEKWTARRILDFSLSVYPPLRLTDYMFEPKRASYLRTILSQSVKYGIYTEEYKEVERAKLMTLSKNAEDAADDAIRSSKSSGRKVLLGLCNSRHRLATAPLFRDHITQLLYQGETRITRLAFPSDSDEGHHVLIAPLGEKLHVKMDMVGIHRESLEELLLNYRKNQQQLPASVGHTPLNSVNDEIHRGLDGSPSLNKGKNSRQKVEEWIAWQADNLKKMGDNMDDLAGKIKLEADRWGYESERKPLSEASIIKMIPAGITGGRVKNGERSKK